MFCASVFIFLIAVVLLVVAVKYGSSMCSTGTRCGGSPDAIAIGSTVIDTSEGEPTEPQNTDVNAADASIIPDPPALDESRDYPVSAAEEAEAVCAAAEAATASRPGAAAEAAEAV